jgi:hypothetical protein
MFLNDGIFPEKCVIGDLSLWISHNVLTQTYANKIFKGMLFSNQDLSILVAKQFRRAFWKRSLSHHDFWFLLHCTGS